VDLFNRVLRLLTTGLASIFGEAHPFWSLTVISVLVGIGMLVVFRHTSNQEAILRAKRRLQAHLLELRLYGDDLSQVWQAQKSLLAANFRYVGLMLVPALYLTVPLVILLVHLDGVYGLAPMPVGEPGVVTVQWTGPLGENMEAPRLEAPPEVAIETPAVRAIAPGQFSWRIRASQPVNGSLRFSWNGESWEKTVNAGGGMPYLSVRRVTGFWDALIYPGEDRLVAGSPAWVEIRYPARAIELAGVEIHWLIWFFVVSMVGAYALKGYFKVTL
jgi:uncharacterized membrane protein (DUF106 family)